MSPHPPLPKLASALRAYDLSTFRHDLVAGITVGLVALPLAMAFAIASGLPPQSGLFTAIVAGLVVSTLGGSAVQIGGPTGAFVVVVSGVVATYGIEGLFVCTMMAGVLLVIAGVTGTGSAVRYIPRPVVVGFTNGIAVVIASTQIRDFFGLTVANLPGDFLPRLRVLAGAFHTISPAATLVAVLVLVTTVLVHKYLKRVPGTVAGLAVGTAVAWMGGLPVETIGSRFGSVPTGLPAPHLPHLELAWMATLLRPALTVATLGAIESLMSAVVADRMSGDRHDPNVELVAQGAANVVSPLFGGLPVTGAIARTATNVRSGARTPVSGLVHALTLLAILAFFSAPAAHIPMAVLAGLLAVVAWNMGEWHEIPQLLRQTKTDVAVWLATFVLTVVADLTIAVEVGMLLAAFLFIRRVSATTTVGRVTADDIREGHPHVLQGKVIPDYVEVLRIHGPLLFGSTEQLRQIVDARADLPHVVIFRLRNMTAIDATGLRALEDAAADLTASGRTAIFCGARSQPTAAMQRAGFADRVGRENVCANINDALTRAAAVQAASTIDRNA